MSLGRGLDSLIPKKTAVLPTAPSPVNPGETIGGERIWQIPPSQIVANPHQPRREFAPGAMEDLINSIRQHGIVQPLVVTKEGDKYELIAGERRLRAAQALELPTVPAIVREASASQKLEIAIIENVQRQDLNSLDEAVAYQRLIDEFSLTQEDVAKKIGKLYRIPTSSLSFLFTGLDYDLLQADHIDRKNLPNIERELTKARAM